MVYLAEHPIGKVTEVSQADVSKLLTELPARHALARADNAIGLIKTHDTPPKLDGAALEQRMAIIRDQTRKAFCRPADDVDNDMNGQGAEKPKPSSPPPNLNDTIVLDRNELPDRWDEVVEP